MDRALGVDDPDYPARLRDLAHPPDPVFLRGPWDHEGLVVAIVGTRSALGDGIDMARRLARDLAREGVAVVSGLALGIDAAAHEGALDAGGRTGAVLGTPLDRFYPPGNRELQESVAQSLGTMSEIATSSHATPGTFPTRNRLIAALAHAVVIVQGSARSGALHTVIFAESLGRPVGAVPWHADDPNAAAPHALIRARRAVLVRDAGDVMELLDRAPSPLLLGARAARGLAARGEAAPTHAPPASPASSASPASAASSAWGDREGRVLAGLSRRAEPIDVVASRAALGAAETSAALLALELAGLARREPGGRYRRSTPA